MNAIIPFLPYVILLTLIYLYISFSVIRLRYKHKSPIGVKESPELEYAVRGHGNFAEYTPLALILLLLTVLTGANPYISHAIAVLLTAGRLFHAYCFVSKHNFVIRRYGMIMTFLSLIVSISALSYIFINHLL